MRLPLILRVISTLCFAATMAVAVIWSKPGCPDKCGNVTIPYPFGIGSKCSANSNFTVICANSTRPILSSINMEALEIFVEGTVRVKQPVSPLMNCSYEPKKAQFLATSLVGSPFTISAYYNSLVILGCQNLISLMMGNGTTGVRACLPRCDSVNYCQTTIPPRLQELQHTYQRTEASKSSSCGYAFLVDRIWFEMNYSMDTGLPVNVDPFDKFGSAPLVLEWELHGLSSFGPCSYRSIYPPLLYPESPNYYYESPDQRGYYYDFLRESYIYESPTRYCDCGYGLEGNPYLSGGCSDINECGLRKIIFLCKSGTCVNEPGSFRCQFLWNDNNRLSRVKMTLIVIGSVLAAIILLLGAWRSAKAIRKRIKANRRRKFFKRNGGLLLEQQLSSTEYGLEKTMLFSSKELAQATDHYNENRILGRGGQGTVYKGMLTDGRIVAVKKSKKVDEGDLQVFINEVVIVSQINHRNVVKLLGCCLETEVPLLVYEFIPNGTLFEHIHDPSEEFLLSWDMRVRIAREIAGALAYLHSVASVPIYHRDIKSTNILLDDKYRAKVSDFGTSRSVAIDQTHLTTRVLGTFGYLDPEYFQSSQFTEKSDVYSFGVVMVELLTGEKAVSSARAEVGRSLATHFLHSMEEDQLFDILNARVLKEGRREEIVGIAQLARRCLHLNGKRRPTMKEVAIELEGIQMQKQGSVFLQNHEDIREYHSIELPESSEGFSSTSEIMNLDATTAYATGDEHQFLDEARRISPLSISSASIS